MAQNKSTHFVWSAVYLDYPTQMSEISVNPMSFISNRINAEYEQDASFKVNGDEVVLSTFVLPFLA